MKKNNNWALTLGCLVRRNIGIYLKDKMMVFFSVLTPVIVLLLYILFLGDMQADMVMEMLRQEEFAEVLAGIDEATINMLVRGIINNWMIAGVMGVSCITVAFNANTMMVRDRERGNINDVLSAPVKRWVMYASYIISCFVITFCICFAILLISIIYLACTHGLMMNFVDFLAILGNMLLSIVCSSFVTVLIVSFIKSEGALTAINGLFSAAIGFLIGAYMPFSMLPNAIQYIACFIPGTYGAGIFRNIFMQGPLRMLSGLLDSSNVSTELIETLVKDYSIEMDFFGHTISVGWMVFALAASVVIAGILLVIFYSNKKTNFFQQKTKKLRRKRKN